MLLRWSPVPAGSVPAGSVPAGSVPAGALPSVAPSVCGTPSTTGMALPTHGRSRASHGGFSRSGGGVSGPNVPPKVWSTCGMIATVCWTTSPLSSSRTSWATNVSMMPWRFSSSVTLPYGASSVIVDSSSRNAAWPSDRSPSTAFERLDHAPGRRRSSRRRSRSRPTATAAPPHRRWCRRRAISHVASALALYSSIAGVCTSPGKAAKPPM